MIHKYLYILGRNWRNPSMKAVEHMLKKSSAYTLAELEKIQLQQFQKLITHAYQYTTYYKKLLDDNNLTPESFQTLADIKKIPILTKKELLKNNQQIHSAYNFKKIFSAKTSGTSGEQLVFKRNEYADSFNRAVINHNYKMFEVKPWQCNGYFWGFNFSIYKKLKVKLLDGLQNRFRLFSYSNTAVNAFIKKLKKATYLHGYASSIYELAKKVNEGKIKSSFQLKMIKGTSEKIFDYYQPEIQQAFGLKMISEYGAAETGIIAFECPKGNMHINLEGVIVEEINNEIIVTNLHLFSFPIIRYKLGDYIKLAPKKTTCTCGKNHPVLLEVTGRIGSVVYGKTENYPSLYFYYIFKNLSQNHQLHLVYQVLQKQKGKLIFKIENTLTQNQITLLKNEIIKYFKNDMEFEVQTEVLIKNKTAKQQSFISLVS